MGTLLAAYVIERAGKQPFPDFTARYLTKPLHMRDSGWRFADVAFAQQFRLYLSSAMPLSYYGQAIFPMGGGAHLRRGPEQVPSRTDSGLPGQGHGAAARKSPQIVPTRVERQPV